jgi:zinc transport system substrate-binding protein
MGGGSRIWRTLNGVVALLLGAALLGCARGGASTPSGTLKVTVSILPQRYFVERAGGAYVDVNVMVRPGESPETYEPKPDQLRALGAADLYFSIGVPFESAWLGRFSAANPDMTMVDTTQGIQRIGGPENPDPHIWLSPTLVKVQARTIADALVAADAGHAEDYERNLEAFLGDIDELDAEIRDTLARLKNRRFMVFHPAWGYFARDYDLEMIAIEIGGQEPSATELVRLIDTAKRDGIKVVFAEPEFSTRAAETIAKEIGGRVVLIDPLAEDWASNLRHVAQVLAEQLGS